MIEEANFNELKELNFNGNQISDISVLEKIKFKKLEKLSLDKNKIDKNKNELIISYLKSKIKTFSI